MKERYLVAFVQIELSTIVSRWNNEKEIVEIWNLIFDERKKNDLSINYNIKSEVIY